MSARVKPQSAWLDIKRRAGRFARGCSLGNESCFVRADAESGVDGVWLAANGRWYTGHLCMSLIPVGGAKLITTIFAPACQRTVWRADDGGTWCQEIFAGQSKPYVYVYLYGRLGHRSRSGFTTVECRWRVGAASSETHRRQPPPEDCERQWLVEAGSPIRAVPLDGGADSQELWTSAMPSLVQVAEPGVVRFQLPAPVNEHGRFDAWLCLHARWRRGASAAPASAQRSREASVRSLVRRYMPRNHRAGHSDEILRACAWSKACTQRVWHRYRSGNWGFTNDPPGSTVVTRDAAWFTFGADYFAPSWSGALLDTLVRHAVYPDGKIAEYVHFQRGSVIRNDYGLNINDATPLFILAVAHHWEITADRPALARAYDPVLRAANWIIRQRQVDGLVWCKGTGTNVHGIAGWRNIIPGYRITGAVTELNAECVAALRAASAIASDMGDASESARLGAAARELEAAIAQLVDPATGLFLLTRDEDGPNATLAIELVFPELFEVGPREAALATLTRLTEEDFRCPAGLRTMSRRHPAYDPRFAFGLMGGSWPNATAWVAAAVARHDRRLALELTATLARMLFDRTCRGVSVPGQFPEWFDGETGESCGMSLSPWMGATFVWLIEEALAGTPPVA